MSAIPWTIQIKLEVVVKPKTRGRVKAEKVSKDDCQVDNLIPSMVVIIWTFPPIYAFTSREVNIIQLWSQRLMTTIEGTKKDGNTKDKEEEFMDDVEYESHEGSSPQLSK